MDLIGLKQFPTYHFSEGIFFVCGEIAFCWTGFGATLFFLNVEGLDVDSSSPTPGMALATFSVVVVVTVVAMLLVA